MKKNIATIRKLAKDSAKTGKKSLSEGVSQVKNLKGKLQKTEEVEDKYVVALDIGTEFVKVLTAQYSEDNLEIIGVGMARQDPTAMSAGAVTDIGKVIEVCDKALLQAEKSAKVAARSAIIGVAGELVKGMSNTITYKRENPQAEITVTELEDIISKIQDKAYDIAKNELSWETGSDELEIKIVNSAIISMNIDGYKVTNPIGFQGRDFKLQVYNAFAPLVHVGALQKIASELDLDLLTIAAEPFAVARSVLGQGNDEFSAILVDIGGGTTDIALVNEGGVDGTKMYGIGGRSFSRSIANSLNIDLSEAEELKLKHSKFPDTVPTKYQEDLFASIKSTVELWQHGLQISLEELTGNDQLPNQLLFCGGGSGLKSILTSTKQGGWTEDLQISDKLKVRQISSDDVKNITNSTSVNLGHTFITSMGLLRVGRDTMSVDTATRIQSKVNQLLKL